VIYHVTVGGRTFEISLGGDGIDVDGRRVEASVHQGEGSPLRALHVDHATYPLLARRAAKDRWSMRLRGVALEAEVIDERTKTIRDMSGAGAVAEGPRAVVAPMPGMVLRIEVAEGDLVSEGQGMIIVEAMKMENELRATGAGVVSRVLVEEGDAVEKDQVLIELTASEEGS
jgi:pyruvate carboxylase subunit B